MMLFIAAEADNKNVAAELLTHENQLLATRISTDPEKIRKFVKIQNTDPELASWTMFQAKVIPSSIKQI